eukprot:m.463195 g.463195  ORF g.463195 m.463195 type:complete len:204 (-) comp22953_c0_seq1:176-787(-)
MDGPYFRAIVVGALCSSVLGVLQSDSHIRKGARDNYFVNFSLSVSRDVPRGTVFTLDSQNTMLISRRVNGNVDCGHPIVRTHPAQRLVANSSDERDSITYSIDKITLTEVKNSHPKQWKNCLLTSYIAYKHEPTGTVLRVQTMFVVGYSVSTRHDIHTYDLTTCSTSKATVGFTFAHKKDKGSLVTAELAVPGTVERTTCYKL